jgi:hypothetical protein
MRRRMFTTMLPALLATALAAGCADSSIGNLERRLGALVGIPEDELVRRFDLRPHITEADGARQITFVQNWPDFVMMSFRPIDAPTPNVPGLIDRYCAYTFTIREGRVAAYAFQGAACGWGGYPVIRPA